MSDKEILVKIDRRLADLAPKFLAHCRLTADEIRSALEVGDFTIPRRIGHSLTGTGTSYGFSELGPLGREIERAAHEKDAMTLQKLAKQLDNYAALVRLVFD